MKKLASFCLMLCYVAGGVVGDCRAPKYQPGAIFVDDGKFLALSVSIPLNGFGPSSLICLANSIKGRYPNRENISVYVFSSRAAAQRSLFGQETTKEGIETLSQMHARYVLNLQQHQEYVEIMPFGAARPEEPGPFSSRIDIPTSTAAHCRLEIEHRCVVAMQRFEYPESAGRKASGRVTLAATAERGGGITHIRVVNAAPAMPGDKGLITDAATRHLSTWHLEAGAGAQTIKITYSYSIDQSLSAGGETQVDWSVPTEIRISGSPTR